MSDIKDYIDKLMKLEHKSTFDQADIETWINELKNYKEHELCELCCPCELLEVEGCDDRCLEVEDIHAEYDGRNQDYEEYGTTFDDWVQNTDICGDVCRRSDGWWKIKNELRNLLLNLGLKEEYHMAMDYLIKQLKKLI